ncbi:peptidase M29 [Pusillimonas sp. CC-YST705]|uniref:Peptidase M29 n=1 Tax=Mesopusillimonas faecipullorum TaxID=2755040 RepID=A0ABS8CFD8_9BURK|nr:peptidase M29 [Mesopusillimonas faecipullorum]MCB5364284.1 peptidase M29 [Mesopusillimonas faecipullorum]
MLVEQIENKWVDCFRRVFQMCELRRGDRVAILSETLSRPVNVKLAELALLDLGTQVFHVVLPTPRLSDPVAVRSTGTSTAIQGNESVIAALRSSTLVVDCTVEGLLHSRELKTILSAGARLMMISNEHPEILERLMPDPALQKKVALGVDMLSQASRMRVHSAVGTDLTIDVTDAPARGSAGFVTEPGKVSYWPGGLCLCFPRRHSVNGVVVLDVGDVNLTFKRYLESRVVLTIEDDFVVDIAGNGLDAELMKSYFEAWNDRNAYGVSHVGWGMNPAARWDSLVMYDKHDTNGTELRAFAGNFLISTGANEYADRFTNGHFDLPLRHCSIELDARPIVSQGRLLEPLA